MNFLLCVILLSACLYWELCSAIGRTSTNEELLDSRKKFRIKRLAIKDENKKWLNGNVPYIISQQFSNEDKKLIMTAIENYEKYTCILFKQKQPLDKDYVLITPGKGCSSPVGRQGGVQNVTLGDGCLYLHTILHELMHSIGFEHEHNRPDRDEHIVIHRENIKRELDISNTSMFMHAFYNRGMEYAFKKRKWDELTAFGFNYDYNSVMQYDETSFSKNGKPTMEAKIAGSKLGSKFGFSESDIQKINILYQCINNSENINDRQICPKQNLHFYPMLIMPSEKNLFLLDFKHKNLFATNSCLTTLKWKKYDSRYKQFTDDMIAAGNDSYGNKFYICRCHLISEQIVHGLLFDSFCYITHNETEYQIKEFEVLIKAINSSGTNKWTKVWALHSELPEHAVIAGKEEDKHIYIGRCHLRFARYNATIIGKVIPADNYVGLIRVPFNGKEITCDEFELLICN